MPARFAKFVYDPSLRFSLITVEEVSVTKANPSESIAIRKGLKRFIIVDMTPIRYMKQTWRRYYSYLIVSVNDVSIH
jgi:hypothetical protein